MKYKRPRGTQDILSPDVHTWRYVEQVFETTFRRFGYESIRTPIFESTDLAIGWDGYYRGKLSAQEVYIYKFNLEWENGQKFKTVGNVTLFR